MVVDFAKLCPVKIEDEYKKNDRLKAKDIEEFKKWALSKPNYPRNIPDILFALFLCSSDFKLDDAKIYFHNNIKERTEVPEMFSNRDPLSAHVRNTFGLIEAWMSPKTTTEGYRVLYTGFINTDSTNYSFSEGCKAFLMVGESYVLKTGTNPGIIVVLDAKGGTYRHLLKAKMHIINRFLHYIQEAIPIRIVQVHVININPVIDKIMFLVKPLIKKTLMENIFFHSSDMTEFYKYVPKDILPKELGGTVDISRRELQHESETRLEALREWFIEEQSLRLSCDNSNEKEQSKTRFEEPEASFKSLSID